MHEGPHLIRGLGTWLALELWQLGLGVDSRKLICRRSKCCESVLDSFSSTSHCFPSLPAMTFSAFNFFWARKLPAMTVSTSEYEPLTSELLETEGSVPFVHEKQTGSHIKRSTWSSPGVILFQAMFLLALVFFAIVTVTTSRRGSCSASDELCTRHMSAYCTLAASNHVHALTLRYSSPFDRSERIFI